VSAVLAYDVGGTWLRAALVDPSGRILAQERARTPVADVEALLDVAVDLAELLSRTGPEPGAVGLAVAGLLDTRRGVCVVSPNLKLRDTPLARPLAQRLGRPLVMLNDLDAAALGEARAAACDDLVALFLGTGVGTGCVVGGRLLQGARGMAVEMGHLVYDRSGPACPMGCRGCYEAFLGGLALGEQAEAAGVGDQATDLLAAWRSGDPRATPILLKAQDAFLSLVPILISAFDPARLVLGGGLGRAWPELLQLGRLVVAEHRLTAGRRDLQVERALLEGDGGLLGAAWSAWGLLGDPADNPEAAPSPRP
jgi:glucokinase